MLPGCIAEYTEREAAKENGYTWREWRAITWQERADCVAFYFLSILVKLAGEEAATMQNSIDMKMRQKALDNA